MRRVMTKLVRTQIQLSEALGPFNKFCCSCHLKREVTDAETLWRHFIEFGGASDFARRWEEAMGPDNRWYCSEAMGQQISDPRLLWNYYIPHCKDRQQHRKVS